MSSIEYNTKKYKRLVDLYCNTIRILNDNKIIYWIADGTLLGWDRNHSIVPWDYDVNLCILDTDYEKVISLLNVDFNYYNDDGCSAIILKDPDDINNNEWYLGIDFIKYKIVNDNGIQMCKNCMNAKTLQEYPCLFYDNTYDEIMPLKQDILCGQIVYVPNCYKQILLTMYIDLSIPSSINIFDYPKPYTTIQIDKSKSLEYSLSNDEHRKKPFISSKVSSFFPTKTKLYDSFMKESEIFGYYADNEDTVITLDSNILQLWHETDKLPFKLLDSYCTDYSITPEIIIHNSKHKYNDNKSSLKLNYALSGCGNTAFHIDPPYGDGWVYMYNGEKLWLLIDPTHIKVDILFLKNATFTDIIDAGYIIYSGIITDDKFIYFPESWPHAVITTKKSIGCAGYL